ncbi:jg21969 [Pararge aegeria aegeria]|uniref:Jg21969 protein n=1 Tax=Pararge aegeria aegeria TaxID=348720 RepID=A0A8S4S9Q1_9NEOP|nr:jg21969 [Pararge aegeria aegeria]
MYYSAVSDSSSDSMEVTDIRWYDLRQSLKETFPWLEYLARVGWTPCSQYVWVQMLDRKQQHLELALVPVSEFSSRASYDNAPADMNPADTQEPVCVNNTQQIQVLITETAPDAWVNVHDILHFLPSSPGTVKFIWASEETGHLHLYLVTCSVPGKRAESIKMSLALTVTENIVRKPACLRSHNVIKAVRSPPLRIGPAWWTTALTPSHCGRRPVPCSGPLMVDESRGLVYFVGLRETPLERHLYVAPFNPPRPHQVTLLSTVGHSHTVDMDEECSMAVITSSNISSVPNTRVYRVTHGPSTVLLPHGSLVERACSETSDTRSFNGSWDSRSCDGDDDSEVSLLVRERSLSGVDVPPPQILSTRLSCGLMAYCTLWRCAGAGRRPTVLHVYGGPEVQTVTNSYKGIRQLRMHMLAARGFNVVSVDSRGSKHRGRAWEAAIKGKMGQVELDDQVEVLQWLAKETGCIDMERVAIHGWSYGENTYSFQVFRNYQVYSWNVPLFQYTVARQKWLDAFLMYSKQINK